MQDKPDLNLQNSRFHVFIVALLVNTIDMVDKPVRWLESRTKVAVQLFFLFPVEALILLVALPISLVKTVYTVLTVKKAE